MKRSRVTSGRETKKFRVVLTESRHPSSRSVRVVLLSQAWCARLGVLVLVLVLLVEGVGGRASWMRLLPRLPWRGCGIVGSSPLSTSMCRTTSWM